MKLGLGPGGPVAQWPSVIDKPWLDPLDEDSLPFFFDFFWVYYVEIVDGHIC